MRVRPSTLTAKMTMRTISGVRIRRSTRKIDAEAWAAEEAARRMVARCGRGSSSRRSIRIQKSSSGFAMTPHPRWKDTVSTTSSTTETMLASSAPAERETTLAVQAAVIPAVETYVA